MSDSDDYLTEMMFNNSTDRDIERLFDGTLDPANDLASVADLVESLRAEASIALGEGTVAAFVQSASAATGRQRAVEGAAASPARTQGTERGPLLVSLRRRVAAIAVAAAVFVGGISGMAVAADDAKPGDALYGIDRTLEAVGIGNGRTAERLDEVQALVDAGDIPRGLRHAAVVVEANGSGHSVASIALLDAADRVSSDGSVPPAVTRERVAELLSYLLGSAENSELEGRTGNIDGSVVAGLARDIGRSGDRPNKPSAAKPPGNRGSSDKNPIDPPGRPDFTPGQPSPPGQTP